MLFLYDISKPPATYDAGMIVDVLNLFAREVELSLVGRTEGIWTGADHGRDAIPPDVVPITVTSDDPRGGDPGGSDEEEVRRVEEAE